MTNQKKTDYICISKESEGPAPDTLDETLPFFPETGAHCLQSNSNQYHPHKKTATGITLMQVAVKLYMTHVLPRMLTAIARNYQNLNGKGEYSVEFLCVLAILLMRQEKTNNPNAYMFKDLLEALKAKDDIFKIVSVATHR